MASWIINADTGKYDVFSAFEDLGTIDWHNDYNYEVGDIIYIYIGQPYGRIAFKCLVEKINIKSEDTIKDEKYWIDKIWCSRSLKMNEFVRLKLIKSINTKRLSFSFLKSIGVNYYFLGKIGKLNETQAKMIEEIISSCSNNSLYAEIPLDEAEKLNEGSKITVTVNKYERNSKARKQCIDYYGCKCRVCGMDFEKKYGELGEGFIHVHHLVPLSKIGEDYEVDPLKDLIPVCPNCHAMIHRLQNLDELSVDEIREKLLRK